MAENLRVMVMEMAEGRKVIRPSGYSKRLKFSKEQAAELNVEGPLTDFAKVVAAEAQKSIDAGSADVVPGNLVTAGAKVAGVEITGVKVKVLLDVPADMNQSGYKTIAGADVVASDGSSMFGSSTPEYDDEDEVNDEED